MVTKREPIPENSINSRCNGTDYPVCPWCNKTHSEYTDSEWLEKWQFPIARCESCGRTFIYSTETETLYTTERLGTP